MAPVRKSEGEKFPSWITSMVERRQVHHRTSQVRERLSMRGAESQREEGATSGADIAPLVAQLEPDGLEIGRGAAWTVRTRASTLASSAGTTCRRFRCFGHRAALLRPHLLDVPRDLVQHLGAGGQAVLLQECDNGAGDNVVEPHDAACVILQVKVGQVGHLTVA